MKGLLIIADGDGIGDATWRWAIHVDAPCHFSVVSQHAQTEGDAVTNSKAVASLLGLDVTLPNPKPGEEKPLPSQEFLDEVQGVTA